MAREPYRWLLPALLALCIARLWLMPLGSSFWLDETATVFVAQHGAAHPSILEAGPQSWRSWYYPAIRLNGAVFGYSEVAARMPSIVAMAALLALLAALVRRLLIRKRRGSPCSRASLCRVSIIRPPTRGRTPSGCAR